MFSEVELQILNNMDSRFDCIKRHTNGDLEVFNSSDTYDYSYLRPFNHLFKDIKPDAKPIKFRKFRKGILNKFERQLLQNVTELYNVICITKKNFEKDYQYIQIEVKSEIDFINLPLFRKDSAYSGMEPNKNYTLKELGLTEDSND